MPEGKFIKSQVITGGIDTFDVEECFATENDMKKLRDMVIAKKEGKDLVVVLEEAPRILSIAVSILASIEVD